jgi:hypothetical protein
MKIMLLAVFCSIAVARADFASDQYTDHPDVLLRIVTAAENDPHLKSAIADTTVLYLRKAEYIGSIKTSFDTVHVAQMFYIRSAPRDTKLPSRGHTYIVFLDDNFKIRNYWSIDLPDESLVVNETKLISGKTVVLDYEHLPKNGEVIFDDKVFGVPKWDK